MVSWYEEEAPFPKSGRYTPVYRKEKAAGVGGPQWNVSAGAGMDRIQEPQKGWVWFLWDSVQ